MEKTNRFFSIGKIKHKFLNNILKDFVSDFENKDKRIILGSKIGEDAAVIDMGDKYLVAKTDPITFATNEIGYYSVIINVNDVVCTGATPKWFQSTILLPEKRTNEELIEEIFKSIHDTCDSLDISVIGGHTEVTVGIDRPIVIGSLLGEVEKEKLVKTSGVLSNDALILTKGIFIEGTSIIGREKEDFLIQKGYNRDFIDKCKNYLFNPGISIFNEAFLANKNFKINAMHDPTEGGLSTGIAEMTIASKKGVLIEKEKILILPEPLELSKIFYLDPMGTISSGSLLISINNEYALDLVEILKKNKVSAEIIGKFTAENKKNVIIDEDGIKKPFIYSEIDEITKIFN
ncbi:MAG: AIR synthase related protein [Promethearchaeota archaeon]|jgi:hydrogenase maturation factor